LGKRRREIFLKTGLDGQGKSVIEPLQRERRITLR
jgi:hypothetical protein